MGDRDELDDEGEDAEEANHHPYVKVGDIADIRSGISDTIVHGDQGEEGGHANTNPGSHLGQGQVHVEVAYKEG